MLLTVDKIYTILWTSAREIDMTKKWEIARTMAHLHVDGNYSGISVSLKNPPAEEILKELNLPPLPKKGG
jgi:hypothetical protein